MFRNLKLYHYTSKLLKLEPIHPREDTYNGKPDGLWLSIDDAWLQWCKEEGFWTFDCCNYFRYQFGISPQAKIYVVNDDASLRYLCSFDSYSKRCEYLYQNYDGIAFLNYDELKRKFEIKFKTIWFYSIDVPSMCIWNINVLSITNVEHVVADV